MKQIPLPHFHCSQRLHHASSFLELIDDGPHRSRSMVNLIFKVAEGPTIDPMVLIWHQVALLGPITCVHMERPQTVTHASCKRCSWRVGQTGSTAHGSPTNRVTPGSPSRWGDLISDQVGHRVPQPLSTKTAILQVFRLQ